MLASAQMVLQRATGSLLEDYEISMAGAKAGVVEADHYE